MLTRQKILNIQQLHKKTERDKTDFFIAEGPKAVEEFLTASNTTPVEIFALSDWLETRQDILHNGPAIQYTVGEKDLARLSSLKTPNKVLAVFTKPHHVTAYNGKTNLALALDEIQDPGNMGTIIRCADWFGVHTIFSSPTCVDPYSPKVVQATMGSLARINILSSELPAVLSHWQQHECPVYAATLKGESINKINPTRNGIVLIGNESRGISDTLLKLASHHITIPRIGMAESLNAGVATGIILSWLTLR